MIIRITKDAYSKVKCFERPINDAGIPIKYIMNISIDKSFSELSQNVLP